MARGSTEGRQMASTGRGRGGGLHAGMPRRGDEWRGRVRHATGATATRTDDTNARGEGGKGVSCTRDRTLGLAIIAIMCAIPQQATVGLSHRHEFLALLHLPPVLLFPSVLRGLHFVCAMNPLLFTSIQKGTTKTDRKTKEIGGGHIPS